MYNEKQKRDFIEQDRKNSGLTKQTYTAVFNDLSSYESDWGLDLCVAETAEVYNALDNINSYSLRSRKIALDIIQSYVNWCNDNGIITNDNILGLSTKETELFKNRYVKSPDHLQEILDGILDPEEMETIDNIFRCYIWMIYSGFRGDALCVTTKNVDLENLYINYNGKKIKLYENARKAFEICVRRDEFYVKHQRLGTIIKKRALGNVLLRGVRESSSEKVLQVMFSRKQSEFNKRNGSQKGYGISTIRESGIFFRAYMNEIAGEQVDLYKVIDNRMSNHKYWYEGRDDVDYNEGRQYRKALKDYNARYETWKKAFSLVTK